MLWNPRERLSTGGRVTTWNRLVQVTAVCANEQWPEHTPGDTDDETNSRHGKSAAEQPAFLWKGEHGQRRDGDAGLEEEDAEDGLPAPAELDAVAVAFDDGDTLADRPTAVVRSELALPPKAGTALRAGSVGPWQPGGISPFQVDAGRQLAETRGLPYDPRGATPAP